LPSTTDHEEDSKIAGKSKEQIKAEREAKRLSKKAGKTKDSAEIPAKSTETQKTNPRTTGFKNSPVQKSNSDIELAQKLEKIHISETPTATPSDPLKSVQPVPEKAKPATKAERRALQEAQKAAKQKALDEKKVAENPQKKLNLNRLRNLSSQLPQNQQ
jgi:translation initiation factor eIF-2B subunit delta